MISHLRTKPSKEKIIETIHQAAKIEFDFLINGVKIDLIGFEVEEVLQIIDKKTKIIKHKVKKYLHCTDSNSSDFFCHTCTSLISDIHAWKKITTNSSQYGS